MIDLGGRRLAVLHVPGHTPDAVALLDEAAGLLFTGDTFYEGPIWLYVPETDLAAFAASAARLAALAPRLKKLLPAHNVAVSSPGFLPRLRDAIGQVRAGAVQPLDKGSGQLEFAFDGFSILTSRAALAAKRAYPARGGSGVDAPAVP